VGVEAQAKWNSV